MNRYFQTLHTFVTFRSESRDRDGSPFTSSSPLTSYSHVTSLSGVTVCREELVSAGGFVGCAVDYFNVWHCWLGSCFLFVLITFLSV